MPALQISTIYILRDIVKALGYQINNIIRPNRIDKIIVINKISENYITYETNHDIASVLNSHFVNIRKHISESRNAGPYDHYQYLKCNYANSLLFVNVEEIFLSLRNKPGNINTFSTSVLKIIRHHVSHVLCHIINFSLRTGIFPDWLKLARVTPIPNGGD